jgi:hypothetical protein
VGAARRNTSRRSAFPLGESLLAVLDLILADIAEATSRGNGPIRDRGSQGNPRTPTRRT